MAKWKLINSLLSTICILTVMIMSCGLIQDRLLSTRGKRWMEHVANMREKCVQVLVSKPEGKCLLVRPRHRWEYNNVIVLQRVVFDTWTELSASEH